MFVFFIYFVMLLVKDFFKSKYLDAVSNVGDRVDQLLCVLFCVDRGPNCSLVYDY